MSREAMKLALEKIANALPAYIDGVAAREYLTVIHKALAEQPTQQGHSCYCPNCEALSKELAELQAQKPIAWRVKWPAIGGGYKWMMVDSPLMEKEGFVNEALYGKAQALAEQPAQQEPDAFVPREAIRTLSGGANHVPATLTLNDDGGKAVAVFLSPQPAQRTWVNLTDKEEVELWESTDSDWELMKRVEAKLKEKNT